MFESQVSVEERLTCHHCGESCDEQVIKFDDKNFCCSGCRAVYELFVDTGLQDIYLDTNRIKPQENNKYNYLDNREISDDLLNFKSDDYNTISVTLPAIHCSSCVYLLENLQLFTNGVSRVSVNFVKKRAEIHYNPNLISLSELSTLLDRLGYPPQFGDKVKPKSNDDLSIKIGVAAFCFGNIMLLSFPEYLGFDEQIDESFQRFFSYLNLFLALPVILYSGFGYLKSAWAGLKAKYINIDVPIALGIIALFFRSSFEIIAHIGPGYFDSLSGLIFFLLIGKWFQNKTYENLSFERDYKSYFPLAATKIIGAENISIPIKELKEGDKVLVRNQEIIPADSLLISDNANIDYSFVTGEEVPVGVSQNDKLYAGGRQVGEAIEVLITKPSSQSYLTSLWNNSAFEKANDTVQSITDQISKYFTITIILIATGAAIYWMGTPKVWEVFTAVLIVACPCALALSGPFTNGNLLRVYGRNKLYLKNALSVEKLNNIDTIVFDKTGTLSQGGEAVVKYVGSGLSVNERQWVAGLTKNSMHPSSKKINQFLNVNSELSVENYHEEPGAGVYAVIDKKQIKLGSQDFIKVDRNLENGAICLSIDDEFKGYFTIKNKYREGLKDLVRKLKSKGYSLMVLSGDHDQEREELIKIFDVDTQMFFKQGPQDKLEFIKKLQQQGNQVMMLGDGLNDAGAIKQSDIGIAVTEDVSLFSPACDGILEANNLVKLDQFLALSKKGRSIVTTSFVISFMYNIVGLSFAVAGALTPIFAAVLMPLSSISVVAFTTLAGNYFSTKKKLI